MRKTKGWGCVQVVILISLLVSVMGGCLPVPCFAAQEDFPKKEVTIICSMAAGGGRDLLARGVAKTMSKYLKVPVVVTNVAGAGGVLGTTRLYNSAPDGYTIGMATMGDVSNQLMEKTDYDLRKAIHIGRAQSSPGCYFVRTDSPFRSWKDFKTYGKPVRYGAFAFGTPETVVAMILATREGWDLKVIGGYGSAAPAVLGLVRGDIDLTGANMSNAKEHIRAGVLKPIMIIDRKRHPDFPDIPLVGDLGYPELANFTPDTWFLAPPGVPRARVKILEDALMKTINDTEFVEWAKGASVDPLWMGGEEFTVVVNQLFNLFEKYKGEIQKYMQR
jgi:tripartite-type tricarboxylate transporter receptor subunit TctC